MIPCMFRKSLCRAVRVTVWGRLSWSVAEARVPLDPGCGREVGKKCVELGEVRSWTGRNRLDGGVRRRRNS